MLCYLVKRVTFNIDAMNLFFLIFFSFERVSRGVLYISIFVFLFIVHLSVMYIFFHLENATSSKQRFFCVIISFFLFHSFLIRLSFCCLSCCLSAFLSTTLQYIYYTIIRVYMHVVRALKTIFFSNYDFYFAAWAKGRD